MYNGCFKGHLLNKYNNYSQHFRYLIFNLLYRTFLLSIQEYVDKTIYFEYMTYHPCYRAKSLQTNQSPSWTVAV